MKMLLLGMLIMYAIIAVLVFVVYHFNLSKDIIVVAFYWWSIPLVCLWENRPRVFIPPKALKILERDFDCKQVYKNLYICRWNNDKENHPIKYRIRVFFIVKESLEEKYTTMD